MLPALSPQARLEQYVESGSSLSLRKLTKTQTRMPSSHSLTKAKSRGKRALTKTVVACSRSARRETRAQRVVRVCCLCNQARGEGSASCDLCERPLCQLCVSGHMKATAKGHICEPSCAPRLQVRVKFVQDCLFWAAMCADEEAITLCLANGAQPDEPNDGTVTLQSPIHICAELGTVSAMKLVVAGVEDRSGPQALCAR